MPTLKLDDVELSYVQHGDGPDIVWIPGGDQRGVHFAEQYEAFPDFRNTAYDPRGVGETISHEGPPWTTADFAPRLCSVDTSSMRSARGANRPLHGFIDRATACVGLPRTHQGRDPDGYWRRWP